MPQPGDELLMSGAMGKGFKVQEACAGISGDGGKHVLLVGVGTGIAPLRAAIESGVLGLDKGDTTCSLYAAPHRPRHGLTCPQPSAASLLPGRYFGARTMASMPYMDKFSQWEAAGVRVVPVLSQVRGGWSSCTLGPTLRLPSPLPRNACPGRGLVVRGEGLRAEGYRSGRRRGPPAHHCAALRHEGHGRGGLSRARALAGTAQEQ